MIFLGNAFSLQMLDLSVATTVNVTPVTAAEVATSGFKSVVGHEDTANVLTDMLGVSVDFNRESVKLNKGDVLFVAQITGGRLQPGTTTLPEGFSLSFVKVTI